MINPFDEEKAKLVRAEKEAVANRLKAERSWVFNKLADAKRMLISKRYEDALLILDELVTLPEEIER